MMNRGGVPCSVDSLRTRHRVCTPNKKGGDTNLNFPQDDLKGFRSVLWVKAGSYFERIPR